MNSRGQPEGQLPFSDRFPRLDPGMAELLDRAAAAGLPPLTTLSPPEARARVAAGNATRDRALVLATTTEMRVPDGPSIRVYTPASASHGVAVVYAHGGGWLTGDLDYSDEVCRLMAARAEALVVSVDYRLAPEHPFPAAFDDVVDAVDWVARGGLGDPLSVVVAGDSAGGGLVASAAQVCAGVVGQLLLYPALDADVSTNSYATNSGVVLGVAEMSWFFDHYVPDPASRVDPRFAPIHGDHLGRAPRAIVVVAGHDPLRDGGVLYAHPHAAAGVPVELVEEESLPHGFLRFTGQVAAAAEAADRVVDLAVGLVRAARGATGEAGGE